MEAKKKKKQKQKANSTIEVVFSWQSHLDSVWPHDWTPMNYKNRLKGAKIQKLQSLYQPSERFLYFIPVQCP